jgi:hypothetical protein
VSTARATWTVWRRAKAINLARRRTINIFTVAAVSVAGVKRVSRDVVVSRRDDSLVNAAKEVAERGTFDYLDDTLATPAMNAFMKG